MRRIPMIEPSACGRQLSTPDSNTRGLSPASATCTRFPFMFGSFSMGSMYTAEKSRASAGPP